MPNTRSKKQHEESEYRRIAAEWEIAKQAKAATEANGNDQAMKLSEKQRETQFTVKHGLLIAWFGIIIILHGIGLYLFTNGFLLTRLVLNDRSQCAHPPIDSKTISSGCWHPKTFDKTVLIVIDALRYDFTVPFQAESFEDVPKNYHNSFPVLYEMADQNPENAILLPFIADPPTTTLQRLNGLTTGTLPTFIDAGSNFAGEAIDEDNLIEQLYVANKTVVLLGDDTWHSLFPNYFDPNLTKAYDSFNVWDLHTLDNGVIEHIFPLLTPQNTTKWDFLIGHFLGVDHAGHRYGPDHPAMTAKLRQMDEFIRSVMDRIDDQTLLVVLGDHGMDAKGDHGGESDDEIQAALWMYSKRPFFGRRNGQRPPLVATDRAVAQIDLVPTLALLLGLPIPFNNLGAPIFEAFASKSGNDYENLTRVYRLAAAQIKRYMDSYTSARRLDSALIKPLEEAWKAANDAWGDGTNIQWNDTFKAFSKYQTKTLSLCRELWARFNVPSMILGIGTLFISLLLLLVYSQIQGDVVDLTPTLVSRGGAGLLIGATIGTSLSLLDNQLPLLQTTAFATGVGASLGSIWALLGVGNRLRLPFPTSIPTWMAVIFTIALSGGFASNSYTIWEDRILVFLLASVSFVLFVSSMAQETTADRAWGCYHAILFALLTRVSSFSRLCREEQMPYCVSTYYSSSNSSTSASWHLFIPVAVAFTLPGIIKQYYQATQSYHHSAVLWYGIAFRMGLWLSASYWVLNTADDHDWYGISEKPWPKPVKVMIAQTALGILLAVGYSIYSWSAPYMAIISPSGPTENPDGNAAAVSILGYGNVHGTRYFPLVSIWAGAIILLQKPLGGGTIAAFTWQILCLLELFSAFPNLRTSALGPVSLALLGAFHFFTTGHQAVLSSIQYDAAFIALSTIRMPFSFLFMFFNTLGAQFLAGVAVPLLCFWKIAPREKNLLGKVSQNVAVHLAFHTTIALATAMWAAHLRRHLMLFRVFCPRFLVAGVTLMGVDIGTVLGGLLGTRWTFLSVNSVFNS